MPWSRSAAYLRINRLRFGRRAGDRAEMVSGYGFARSAVVEWRLVQVARTSRWNGHLRPGGEETDILCRLPAHALALATGGCEIRLRRVLRRPASSVAPSSRAASLFLNC